MSVHKKKVFLGTVVEVRYEKAEICHFWSKMVQKYFHGNLKISYMHFFLWESYFDQNRRFSQMG